MKFYNFVTKNLPQLTPFILLILSVAISRYIYKSAICQYISNTLAQIIAGIIILILVVITIFGFSLHISKGKKTSLMLFLYL